MLDSTDHFMNVVKNDFPMYAQSIEKLYVQDGMFRSLCEEYTSCLQYLAKYKKEASEKNKDLAEFESLLSDLSRELTKFIESHKP
jgi:hypothetical protein